MQSVGSWGAPVIRAITACATRWPEMPAEAAMTPRPPNLSTKSIDSFAGIGPAEKRGSCVAVGTSVAFAEHGSYLRGGITLSKILEGG